MATCVAPGHPECRITCPKGCIAWYDEKYKRCVTRCSGKFEPLKFADDSVISLSVSDYPAGELLGMLGAKAPGFEADFKKLLSFTLESVSIEEIIRFVQKELGAEEEAT